MISSARAINACKDFVLTKNDINDTNKLYDARVWFKMAANKLLCFSIKSTTSEHLLEIKMMYLYTQPKLLQKTPNRQNVTRFLTVAQHVFH